MAASLAYRDVSSARDMADVWQKNGSLSEGKHKNKKKTKEEKRRREKRKKENNGEIR